MPADPITIPVTELQVFYPRGYAHPHPVMREYLAEIEALDVDIRRLKVGTEHEACDGWRTAEDGPLCSCGAPLIEALAGLPTNQDRTDGEVA